MTSEEFLRNAFVSLEVNASFSEAVLHLRDGSRLSFCHRVGERWARADGPDPGGSQGHSADHVLAGMAMFRLNAKHLDIQFADGSRWEALFKDLPGRPKRPDPQAGPAG